jgi:GntR family transcriptional regulator
MDSLQQLSGSSRYALLEREIAAAIETGELAAGSQIPTEDELIRRFAVSRTTVRKAIQNLSLRGFVEIRRGVGTFVAPPRITPELTALTGFVEDMDTLGHKATARLIDTVVVAADAQVARHLRVAVGAQVMRIRRVRLANGVSISLDETYLPLAIGKQVVSHDLEVEPIFSLLEDRYGIALIEAEYELEAALARDDVAAELQIAPGSPVFLIERTSFSSGGQPVDYEILHYRGDLIRFKTRLARRKPVRPR